MKSLISSLIALIAAVNVVYANDFQKGASLALEHGCANCHGLDGHSTSGSTPNLAGQKLKYMSKQMDSFARNSAKRYQNEKISERYHPGMKTILKTVSRKEIDQILSYYSGLPCRTTNLAATETIPKAAERCEICHGGTRSSPFKDAPNLAGQNLDYLKKQLNIMVAASKTPDKKSERYHRLTALMIEGKTEEELQTALKYYASLSCR